MMIASKMKTRTYASFFHNTFMLLAFICLLAGLVIGGKALTTNVITESFEYLKLAAVLTVSACIIAFLSRK